MNQLTTAKTEHPADGSPRWSISGPAGTVCYDALGNHLAILNPAGEVIDSLRKEHADEVRRLTRHYSDDQVFTTLYRHYRTQLAAGGTR